MESTGVDNRAGEMRWQAERKAVMETAVSYWNAKNKSHRNMSTGSISEPLSSLSSISSTTEEDDGDEKHEQQQSATDKGVDVVDKSNEIKGSIVWAGLEPLEFISMFPDWIKRKEVTEINIQVIKI